MKKKKLLLLSYILFTLFQLAFASKTKTLMFVVDVSGSMRRDNLYQKVTDTLCAFIKREFREGDNLILCSFGNDFYINKEILKAATEQMLTILPVIEGLNFRDEWTYMTKAFDQIAKLSRKYRPEKERSPPLYIYIFTDGKNEPPPNIQNPISFTEILKWYFKDFLPKGTFIYVITLGVPPDAGISDTLIGELQNKGKNPDEIRVVENPPGIVRQPPPPDTTSSGKDSGTSAKKSPAPKWILLLVVLVILAIVVVIFYLQSVPKFPRAYLLHLDESRNVINRFNLRSRQKFGSNELRISDDINVPGIMRGSFALIAKKGGAVTLKIIAKNKSVTIISNGTEIRTGETYFLNPDDEFEFSGVRLKYEKGG